MAYLEVSFFNALDVKIHDRRVTTFRSVNVQGLLVYLLLEAETAHQRDWLATLFWPDETQKRGRHNLRQSLYQLRQVLGDDDGRGEAMLSITRQNVQFNRRCDYALDVQAFEAALAQGNLKSAVTLFTGELLPAFASDSRSFEEWLHHKRELYHRAMLGALYQLAERHLRQQSAAVADAVTLAQRQLAMEAWREEAHRQLMRALAMLGDRSAALAQFDRCVAVLDAELGVPPAPETVALFEAIRAGTLPAAGGDRTPAPIPHNLPRSALPFVGRAAESKRLHDLLTDPETPLVTVAGPGGIGKTSLVHHVARQLVDDAPFADGIFFVPLAALATADQLPEAIATAVGFRWLGQIEQLLDFLAARSLLLILDNLEHIQGDSHALLSTLLAGLPRVQFCITSRQRLGRQDEQAIVLGGLPTAAGDGLESEAAQLFLTVARRATPKLHVDDGTAEAIGRICRLTEGMPLALVLAAGWADILHPLEIADKIERDLNFLSGDMADLPDRQRSVRATFAYTWAMLMPEERGAFVALSVFRQGFTRQAARHIGSMSIPILAQLVRKSLVAYDAESQRYAIHELLRQFGADYLAQGWDDRPPFADAVHDAHSRYYLSAIADRVPDMLGLDQSGALRDIAADYANLLAAWRYAEAQGRVDHLHRALPGIYYFHFLSGRELDGIALFESTHRQLDRRLQADGAGAAITNLQARLCNRIYELTPTFDDEIMPDVVAMRDLFRAQGDALEEGLLMNRLADAAIRQRDVATALRIYDEQFAHFQRSGNRFEAEICLTNIMRLATLSGQIERGLAAGEMAKELFQQSGNRLGSGVVAVMAGAYHSFWTGDYATAAAEFGETRQVGEEMAAAGHVITGVVMAHAFGGFLALVDGDFSRAQTFTQAARQMADRKNTAYTRAAALGLEALLAVTEGDYRQAMAQSGAALQLSQEPGAAEFAQLALAFSACHLQQHAQAHQIVSSLWLAIVGWQRQPRRALLLLFMPVVADLYAAQDQFAEAARLLAFARAQPACPRGWWAALPFCQALDARLQEALPADAYRAAQGEGAASEPEGVGFSVLEWVTAMTAM